MESLGLILNGRYFEIPENQRGFSWLTTNIKELVSDLKLARDRAHYMGPIIVTRDTDGDLSEDDYTPTIKCILEDGQQRLTTFFLLMRAVQLRLEEIDEKESVDSREISKLLFYKKGGSHLRLQNKNIDLDACFSNCMLGSPPMPGHKTAPMRALESAEIYCKKLFDNMDRDECMHWKNRLINKARFILVDLDSAGVDRYLTFDAINSRGLPLSQFDKIKNFCILIDSVRNLNLNSDTQWYLALQELDRFSVSQRSSEEAFITELFNVFHDTRVSQGDVHQNFVDKYRPLLENTNTALEVELFAFVKFWHNYSGSYGLMATKKKSVHYGAECTKEAGSWLDRLDNMELPTITRPLLVSGHLTMSKTDFERLAQVCEIYTFRVHAALGRRKDMNSKGIIGLANSVLKNTKDLDYVINLLCSWLTTMAPMKNVVNKISNGEPKYHFDPAVSGWSYCYYFLYEYEISVSPTGVTPFPWGASTEEKKNTQEHILPQDHRDGDWWEAQWTNEAIADKFKHRIGNLVLTAGNSVLGRKPIDKKLNDPSATYDFQCNKATNSEKRITNYTNGMEWGEKNILRREIDILKFMIDRWAIPCCSDNGNIYLSDTFRDIDEKTLNLLKGECFPGIVNALAEQDDDGNGEESIVEDEP